MALRLLVAGATVMLRALAAEPVTAAPGASNPPAVDTAYEALQRLKGMDVEASPALKAAVLRVLATTRGTARFVEIVRDFNLHEQETGLLEVAAKLSREAAGPEAVRVLLGAGGLAALVARVNDPGLAAEQRGALVRSVGNAGDSATVGLLAGVLERGGSAGSVQSEAVQGLARTEAGARRLLELGRAGVLEDAARTTASLALAQSRWPAIRSDAAGVFPLPRSADGGELPPPTELARERGDAVRGAALFRSEKAACIRCHRVGEEGVDVGPALSGIGAKLAREALFESVIDPSAGISFGYEAWSVETRAGEEVFGILASETASDLVIRQPSGLTVTVKKSDIASRTLQKLSVMPAGLAQLLTRRELVDLVEYLATLKAGGPPK